LDYISLSKEADEKFGLGKYEEAKTLMEKGLSLAKRNRNHSFQAVSKLNPFLQLDSDQR